MVALALQCSTPVHGAGIRRGEEFAVDVKRLMDCVREEVHALMMEGAQKSASFCASLCAEKIVAARREMQRARMEERRELERLYGIPSLRGRSSSPGEKLQSGADRDRSLSALRNALFPKESFNTPLASPGTQRLLDEAIAATEYFEPKQVTVYSPTKKTSAAMAGCGGLMARSPQRNQVASPYGGSPGPRGGSTSITPYVAPKKQPEVARTDWKMTALPISAGGGGAGLDSDSCDVAYIDAYDAVQTLEEKTSKASRAMDLLDQALKVATQATKPAAIAPEAAVEVNAPNHNGFGVDRSTPVNTGSSGVNGLTSRSPRHAPMSPQSLGYQYGAQPASQPRQNSNVPHANGVRPSFANGGSNDADCCAPLRSYGDSSGCEPLAAKTHRGGRLPGDATNGVAADRGRGRATVLSPTPSSSFNYEGHLAPAGGGAARRERSVASVTSSAEISVVGHDLYGS